MKNPLVRLLLFIAVLTVISGAIGVWAQSFEVDVNWTHTFATDTAATTKLADTLYSSPFELVYPYGIPGTTRQIVQMSFYHVVRALSGYTDSNWTNDTMICNLQTGVNRGGGSYEWNVTTAIDTFVVRDSGMSTIFLNRATTAYGGNVARFQLIRRDSLEASAVSKAGLSYGAQVKWFLQPILGQPVIQ